MKIAVFHNLPDGGAKITLLEQMKLLKKRNVIDLYTFISNESNIDLTPHCQKHYYYPNYISFKKKKNGIKKIVEDLKTFTTFRNIHKKIAKKIDKKKYDIAFVHGSRITQAPYLLRYLKTPSVYFCQEPLRIVYEYGLRLQKNVNFIKRIYENITRSIRKNIDRENALAAHVIVANSDYTRQNIMLAYGRSAPTCQLGVDTNIFLPHKYSKKKWILYVGGKNWLDGYYLLVDAMKYLNNTIKKKIKIIDTSDLGKLPKNAQGMRDMYSDSFITICPAVLEPLGLVALESMACGTPVIAVDEGGYHETIINGKTGFLIQRNAKQLARKINFIMLNDKLRKKIGKAAREHVKNNWTWHSCVNKLEKIFYKTAKT